MRVQRGLARALAGALGVWMVLWGFAVSGASADANDTSAGASGPLLHGVFWGGSISTENDVDWYVLYTVGIGTFYVEVRPYNVAPCIGQDAKYTLWVTASPQLLTAPIPTPPPPPPPASAPPKSTPGTRPPGGRGTAGPPENCLRARARVRRLQRRQRLAHRLPLAARQREQAFLRHRLRRASDHVRRQC
jgi:hypothetical protein